VKILLINGSPKSRRSQSGSILTALREKFEASAEQAECVECAAVKQNKQEFMNLAARCGALVFIFPLYVDAIPSHLLRLLDESRDEIGSAAPGAKLYAVVNNGFYEGSQNAVALEMMRNFCHAAGLAWGRGVGVGAGPMLNAAQIGRGVMKNFGKALDMLSENILRGESAEDHFFEPNFPRFLYKITAGATWTAPARKNGLTKRQLYSR
jgi:multimeric flavodoxin WrbA